MRSLLLLGLFAGQSAFADEFRVSPAWLEIEGDPGTTVTTTLQISLEGRGMHAVRVYTGDWSWDADGHSTYGGVPDGLRTADLSVSDGETWVDATEPTLIEVSIRIPLDAREAVYGVVFVEEVSPDLDQEDGLRTTSRIAVPVLIDVGAAPDVSVESIDIYAMGEATPLAIAFALRNDGAVHTRPSFRGAVRSVDGSVTTFFGSDRRFLMPGQSRDLSVNGPIGLEPGAYELLGMLEVGTDSPIAIHEWFSVADPLDAVSLVTQ